MQRFDILNRHVDPFGNHFLEASAGTGKTFAIEHLVVRLILESDPPLLLDQILVVTFTRAATRELKGRIRNNLVSAFTQLQKGEAQHDYLAAWIERGKEDLNTGMRRLRDALACFDTAHVFTIHGFCYRALNEFAFEARAALPMSDPDEAQHMGVIHDVVHNFLKCHPEWLSAGQVAQLWSHFHKKPERLKNRLASLVSQEREIAEFPTWTTSFHRWSDALNAFPPMKQVDIIADLTRLASNYKQMGNPRFALQIERLGKMLENKQCSPREFDQFVGDKEFFLEKMAPSNRKVKAQCQTALHCPDLLEQLRTKLLPILDHVRDPRHILLTLGRECRHESQVKLKSCDLLSPDDLLRQMHTSLREKSFVEKVRCRYKAVIIDEFQDTDPLQWEIFHTLFVGSMRSLCLVGDPKQSIYAFRNADLYTYLKAAQCFEEKSRRSLDTNYRSTPSLIAALNRLFAAEKTKGWMSLPYLGISLDVLPVQSPCRPTPGESGGVHFFAAEASRSRRDSQWPSNALEQNAFFPYIVQEMWKHKGSGLWSQFAILVKDRYQAQRVADFLNNFSIPAVVRRSASLCESDAFFALQELIEAICFPSDLSRLKKMLGGPLIGWNCEQIVGSFEKPLLQAAKEKTLLLQDLMLQKGFVYFFDAFLASQWDSDRSVAENILSQGNLDLYCDLRQLTELIAEMAWTRFLSKDEWPNILRELEASSTEEESRLKRRLRLGEDAVQILTMHMSKGLEFDTVFALGVASSSPSQDTIIIQDRDNKRIVPLEEDDPACSLSLKELDAEKLRQLYVALTRAKKRVYVPLALSGGCSSSSPIELYFAAAGLPTFDFALVEAFLNEIREDTSITLSRIEVPLCLQPKDNEEDVTPSLQPPAPPPLFSSQPIVSYSSLAKKLYCARSDLVDLDSARQSQIEAQRSDRRSPSPSGKGKNEDRFGKVAASPNSPNLTEGSIEHETIEKPSLDQEPTLLNMPLGTQTGLVFHSIMEKLFQHGLHFFPEQRRIVDLIDEQIAHTDLKSWKNVLFESVWDLIHLPLQGFSLSQIPPSQVQQEMEFLFPYKDGFIKGFVDLAFEWKNKYYLLDWKTNYLGPAIQDYSPENILKAMHQHDYFLQASIYADALKHYVKLFDNRPFSQCFGGVFYIFVRGKKVFNAKV